MSSRSQDSRGSALAFLEQQDRLDSIINLVRVEASRQAVLEMKRQYELELKRLENTDFPLSPGGGKRINALLKYIDKFNLRAQG